MRRRWTRVAAAWLLAVAIAVLPGGGPGAQAQDCKPTAGKPCAAPTPPRPIAPLAVPVVTGGTALSPTAGGRTVSVFGSGFTGATGVTFGGLAGTSLAVLNDSALTVVTPPHAAGPAAVVVTGPGGSSDGSASILYVAVQVQDIQPGAGPIAGGTIVAISGWGFTGATAVTFGGTPAIAVTVVNDGQLTVVTPAHAAGSVAVEVTAPAGTGTGASFVYAGTPTATAISPASGPAAGGTLVTITGTDLHPPLTVTFGGVAGIITANSPTSLTVTVPPHLAGAVSVLVFATGGVTNGALVYTYNSTPVVSTMFPRGGPASGGTTVTLTGTGFTGATGVTFGGTPATSFAVNFDSQITATSPAHAPGLLDIVVTGPGGSSTPTAAAQFAEGIPFVDGMTSSDAPCCAMGPTAGGSTVTIGGGNFTGATSVAFGGTPGTGLSVINDSVLTVVNPAHAAGPVPVVITTPAGLSAGGQEFQYTATCAMYALPASGLTSGGTVITVTGWGFTGATQVLFDSGTPVAGTGLSVVSDTVLTVITPAHAAGQVPIGVTTGAGTTWCQGTFYYAAGGGTPAVTSVFPGGGPGAGGTTVTLTGTGFLGATGVTFGGAPATSFIVHSDTAISAQSPAQAPGMVDIVVTGPGGPSPVTAASKFAYGVATDFPLTLAMGAPRTLNFVLDAFVTCDSDGDPPTALDDVDCTAADVELTGGLVLVAGPVVTDADVGDPSFVSISVVGNTTGDARLKVKSPWGTGGTPVSFNSASVPVAVVPAELRHIGAASNGAPQPVIGGGAAGQAGIVGTAQAAVTTVRGARHVACTVAANTGVRVNPVFVQPAVAVQVPLTQPLLQLAVTSGGGYGGPQPVGPQAPVFSDIQVFNGNGVNGGLDGSTCFSWVSTQAGDQHLALTYDGFDAVPHTVLWDTDADGNNTGSVPVDRTLITEWSVLERSRLPTSANPADPLNAANPSVQLALQLNTGTGLYEVALPGGTRAFDAVFLGSHTTRTAAAFNSWLAGVSWTVALGPGSCGALSGALSGTTTLTIEGIAGNPARATFAAGSTVGTNCGPSSTATIVFTGTEPGPLGSGATLQVQETLTLTFAPPAPPVKKVLLAWAGQRVLLEHDWRTPPGDTAAGAPVGTCPFTTPNNVIRHLLVSGPGNFLPGLDTTLVSPTEITVAVSGASQAGTMPANPQGACISRVLAEAEDPGEMDVEAWPEDAGGTPLPGFAKVAYAVFYMKFERVTLSLVTGVAKANHNGTFNPDWSPGNPWNAAADATNVNWNVSKDLLVRGRVKGWFLNATPSGRGVDTSDPLNQLPANRWVMPDDWALLAGGPADNADGSPAIGTAETFRGERDIMFGPNNAVGMSLLNPPGSMVAVAKVVTAAGVVNSATSFAVSSIRNLVPGMSVSITNTEFGMVPVTIASVSAGPPAVTLSGGGAFVVPPDGARLLGFTTAALVDGPLFTGPYSLVDIVQGGGTAPSLGSIAAFNGNVAGAAPASGPGLPLGQPALTRETAFGDGDINIWDAPMPPALVSARIRGSGYIKQASKIDVYHTDGPGFLRAFPNPYYQSNIPAEPWIPAVVVGGGYFWDTWGNDGPQSTWSSSPPGPAGAPPYQFWSALSAFLVWGGPGMNSSGIADATITSDLVTELQAIRPQFGNPTIARDLVVYSDNHGEFMVTANGDFKLDFAGCPVASPGGGRRCGPDAFGGQQAGVGLISAMADYPDFRGKHFPVSSNTVSASWRFGGYTDVTVVPGETEHYVYVVFHAVDRDGFCSVDTGLGTRSLHPVLSGLDAAATIGANDPVQTADVTINAGPGAIVATSAGGVPAPLAVLGLAFFSTALNNPGAGGVLEFPFSPLAAPGQTDECQAWVKVSNTAAGVVSMLGTVHSDEGNIGFNLSAFRPAASMAFTIQPGNAPAPGAAFAPQPVVRVYDSSGALASAFSGFVTLSLEGGTAGAALSCTSLGNGSSQAVSGVASWAGCATSLAGGSYRLRATSPGLPDAVSEPFSVLGPLAPQTVPSYGGDTGASTQGVVRVQSAAATLTWLDNSTDETGFRVLRIGGGSSSWDAVGPDLPPNTTTFTDTGLVEGAYYAYWVVALKGVQLYYAPTYTTVVAPLAPARPTPAAAAGLNPTQVYVAWRDNSANEDGFRVLRYIGGNWVNVSGDLAPNSFSFVDGNNGSFPLSPGQTYAYWIVAFRGATATGVSYAPAYVAASTPSLAAPIGGPANMAGSSTLSTATLQWIAPAGLTAADGYQVERLQSNGSWQVVSGPTNLPPGTVSWTEYGLAPATYYAYWIWAVNGGVRTPAGTYITVVTGMPASPSPVSAAGVPGGVHLTWVDNSVGEDGFEVRRYNGSAWVVVGTPGPGATSFTDTGLTPGVTYAYWLTARVAGLAIYANAYIAATAY